VRFPYLTCDHNQPHLCTRSADTYRLNLTLFVCCWSWGGRNGSRGIGDGIDLPWNIIAFWRVKEVPW